MKNTGKQLERVVRLIEESYKDSANTHIFSNYKLPNKDGQEREIDILIISKINGFEVCIAIECKDYNSKVSVDKIDSFQGKCSRLPQIHRKIFVSANGYQKGAVLAANDFGIELLTGQSLTAAYISQLIPIRQNRSFFMKLTMLF
jgi:predicted helicase